MDTMTYILGHIEKYLMRESFDLPEGLSIYGDTFVCDIAIQPLPCQENIFGYKAIIITSIKIRDINTPGDK